MKRGLVKALTSMLDFACAYAGEGNPDARDEQLPVFQEVKREALIALKENTQLMKIAAAAVLMRAKCPADPDATADYAEATAAFDAAVAKYNKGKPGAIR